VLVFDPPYIQTFGVNVTQAPVLYDQFDCVPPAVTLDTDFPQTISVIGEGIGQGNITPVYSRLVANGSAVIVVARQIPAVLIFNVANQTTTGVRLSTNADPLSASSSSDGSMVYIGACDQYEQDGVTCASGSVHVVNTVTGNDQQVPYINNTTNNMCNGAGQNAPVCFPNMVVIKPQ
jgi:hypothetical protein